MRQVQEPAPIHPGQGALTLGDRGCGLVRAVAREDADPEEVRRAFVDRELAIAEQETIGDALAEPLDQLVNGRHRDDPPQDLPWREAQTDRSHDTEQSVAADDQAEQLGIARAADLTDLTGRVDERE